MNYSKGITWFDDCRIPFVDEDSKINFDRPRLREKKEWVYDLGTKWEDPNVKEYNTQGRFPSNLLVSDDMLNDGIITEAKANINYKWNNTDGGGDIFSQRGTYTPRNDKGSNSRYYDIDKWFNNLLKNI